LDSQKVQLLKEMSRPKSHSNRSPSTLDSQEVQSLQEIMWWYDQGTGIQDTLGHLW